jgi:hypothetical protein
MRNCLGLYVPIYTIILGLTGPFNGEARAAGLTSCGEIYKKSMQRVNGLRGTLLMKADPALYKIFDGIRRDSAYQLTADQLAYIKDNQLEGLLRQWQNSNGLVKKLNKEVADLYRAEIHRDPDKLLMRLTKGVGKTLVPVYKVFMIDGRSRAIARKIIADSNYTLTAKELAYIEKKKMGDDLQRFRADVANGLGPKFATIGQVRQINKKLTWSVALSTAALNYADNKYITRDETFDEKNPDGMSRYDDKVELIYLSPMPHVSVRMGGNVYNYGTLDIKRFDLDQYRAATGFGGELSGNHTRVELKLNADERDRLRDYLEGEVGKIYPLTVPYVDCVSQTNNAIKFATGMSIPPIANRSQAMSIAYLKLSKMLGNDKVGDIRFASAGQPMVEKTKDAAINVLDSMLFMKYGANLLLVTPILDQSKLSVDPGSSE